MLEFKNSKKKKKKSTLLLTAAEILVEIYIILTLAVGCSTKHFWNLMSFFHISESLCLEWRKK